jgi:hypothetical protein
MDYKILPGHLYSQNQRINLYYLHNLFKEFAAHISLQMKEIHNLEIPISAGMWGGSYMDLLHLKRNVGRKFFEKIM